MDGYRFSTRVPHSTDPQTGFIQENDHLSVSLLVIPLSLFLHPDDVVEILAIENFDKSQIQTVCVRKRERLWLIYRHERIRNNANSKKGRNPYCNYNIKN